MCLFKPLLGLVWRWPSRLYKMFVRACVATKCNAHAWQKLSGKIAAYGLRAAEVLFSLYRSHIASIHLHRQCRSHHHHSHGETFRALPGAHLQWRITAPLPLEEGHASSIDQLERLPKTASHPFTHGVCQSVRCLQDYSISLLSLDQHI